MAEHRRPEIRVRPFRLCPTCGYASGCPCRRDSDEGTYPPVSTDPNAEATLRRLVKAALLASYAARPTLGDIGAMDAYDGPGGVLDELAHYVGAGFLTVQAAVERRVAVCPTTRSLVALMEEMDQTETTAEACNV